MDKDRILQNLSNTENNIINISNEYAKFISNSNFDYELLNQISKLLNDVASMYCYVKEQSDSNYGNSAIELEKYLVLFIKKYQELKRKIEKKISEMEEKEAAKLAQPAN